MKKTLILFLFAIFCLSLSPNIKASPNESQDLYICGFRIYMVEPLSRWNDDHGDPYHFAFLDYAYDTAMMFISTDTLQRSIVWDGGNVPGGAVTEDNIMAIAVVYDGLAKNAFANPPTGNPFSAYYVDACAASDIANSWPNVANETYTHTVFAEEGTQTWCVNCPIMSDTLHEVYSHSSLPFFYVALVADQNPTAWSRYFFDLNRYGDPTCYFDGGFDVLLGSDHTVSEYENCIQQSADREVPPMDLSVDMSWLNDGAKVQIDLNLIYGMGPLDVYETEIGILPTAYKLNQNYPNPFNPKTTISFELPRKSDVNLTVFNLLGQNVKTLIDSEIPAGRHNVEWDGRDYNGLDVGTGIYFYKLETKDYRNTQKMVLIK